MSQAPPSLSGLINLVGQARKEAVLEDHLFTLFLAGEALLDKRYRLM